MCYYIIHVITIISIMIKMNIIQLPMPLLGSSYGVFLVTIRMEALLSTIDPNYGNSNQVL